jgi:hypothetical protein
MNILYRNLLVIFCFIVLITACSNQVSIQSITSDMVVVKAPPENFIDAYDAAKKECEKNTKKAEYIPDDTVGLEIVAFNCVGEEVAVEEIATETEKSSSESE